jgi:hypothetical protein
MKFLFKLIVLPIITILFVPVLFLVLTYKSVEIPYDEFEPSAENINLTGMIDEQFNLFLEENDDDSVIALGITQMVANQMLASQFRGMNPVYALDTALTDDDRDYVLKQDFFAYQGSWVRFKDDIVEIESGIHSFTPIINFTYKTRLLITFKLEADTEEVVLTLDKLTLGNLPLEWLFGPVSWAVERISGISLSDLINDQLGDWATFDVAKREIRLSVDDLVANQAEGNPESAALMEMLLKFINDNELVEIGFQEGTFDARIALGKARDATPPFVLPSHLRLSTEAELQSILAAKASTLIFSTLSLQPGENPFIELDALTLNRIFDFFLSEQAVSPGVLQQVPLFDKFMVTAYMPYITMDEFFIINIPVTITSNDDPTHIFPTIIKIKSTPSMDGNDLKITLNELSMGTLTLEGEDVNLVLALMGDTDFIQDGAFVIKDFDTQMQQAGMSIISANMVNAKLRLTVQLTTEIDLEVIQDIITDVLEDILNNDNLSPELNEAINDVLDSLLTGDPDEVAQAIEDLIAELEGLDDAEAELLLNELLDSLEGQASDLEDFFNLIPEE